MFWVPTLDDSDIFGQAVRMQVNPQTSAYQFREFFGINGVFSLYGGTRGRIITVQGILIAPDMETLNAAEAAFDLYDDGLDHVLIDTRGRTWENVIYRSDFKVSEEGPRPLVGGAGWGIKYHAAFLGKL